MAGTTFEARQKSRLFGIGNAIRVVGGAAPESVVHPD
jgi:hypothetical protein